MNYKKIAKSVLCVLKVLAVKIIRALKKHNGPITVAGFGAMLAYFLLGGDDGTGVTMAAMALAGVGRGTGVEGAPLTVSNSREVSGELLRSAVDRRVVKIRPMATPIDQISRWGGCRVIGSMKADYYSVDNRPMTDKVSTTSEADTGVVTIKVDNPTRFSVSDTLLVPSITAQDAEGKSCGDLVLYVAGTDTTNISVISVNNYIGGTSAVPSLSAGTELVRMGRAAAELDVQTAQYEAMPTKDFNYCQIFKAQIEQSTLMKLSDKEVGWTLSDQEESAIVDMRLGMEKSFLFGSRMRLTDPYKQEEVMLTGGIWNQAGKECNYLDMDNEALVEITKEAFTGNGGSSKKILVGGSELIASLNSLDHQHVVVGQNNVTRWGLDFTEIRTKFGTLYVVMSEIFDQCGHASDGLVIDPEYITKYAHIPFSTERLNLRKSGQRNTDAVVITEASCLVLRYPSAHMRIVKLQ